MLRNEGLNAGHASPFKGDIRVVEDYMKSLLRRVRSLFPATSGMQAVTQFAKRDWPALLVVMREVAQSTWRARPRA